MRHHRLSARLTALLVPLALAGTTLFVAPAAQADPADARAKNSLTGPRDAAPGERFTLRGSQRFGKVKLRLERRTGGKWKKVAQKKKSGKKFSFATAAPTNASGALKYRVRAVVKKKKRTVAKTSVKVVKQRLTLSSPTAPRTAQSTRFAGTLVPVRPTRPVRVEVHLDGAWKPVGTAGRPSGTGALAATVDTEGYPAWYRVTAAAWNGIPAVSTAPVLATLSGPAPTAIAHRAGASLAPEQTLAALERTVADGVPSMEIDVQLTKDGVPVIVHDKWWDRTTDVETVFPELTNLADREIADLTLAQVKQLDAGSWFGAEFTGERIPTLEEWLVALDGRSHLVLEVKDTEVPGNANIRAVLDGMLTAGPLRDLADAGKLTVSSFGNPYVPPLLGGGDFLKEFAESYPEIPVGVLHFGSLSVAQIAEASAWADEMHSKYDFVDRAFTDRVRAARTPPMSTSVWTADTLAQHRAAIATGAERVISDHPENLALALNPPRP